MDGGEGRVLGKYEVIGAVLPCAALLDGMARFWRGGLIRSESYGAISSIEQRKSLRGGGAWVWGY